MRAFPLVMFGVSVVLGATPAALSVSGVSSSASVIAGRVAIEGATAV